jgi:hypothetical protein
MQKTLIVIGTVIVFGLIWFWTSDPEPDGSKILSIEPTTDKLMESQVKLKLAKPRGKMDDPVFMVMPQKQKSENSDDLASIPPLEARKQLLQQQRDSKKVKLNEEQLNALQQRASSTQKQIDSLITELNQNINDKDLRIKLKTKIDGLMEEYNKMVLPLALQAMSENSNS